MKRWRKRGMTRLTRSWDISWAGTQLISPVTRAPAAWLWKWSGTRLWRNCWPSISAITSGMPRQGDCYAYYGAWFRVKDSGGGRQWSVGHHGPGAGDYSAQGGEQAAADLCQNRGIDCGVPGGGDCTGTAQEHERHGRRAGRTHQGIQRRAGAQDRPSCDTLGRETDHSGGGQGHDGGRHPQGTSQGLCGYDCRKPDPAGLSGLSGHGKRGWQEGRRLRGVRGRGPVPECI